jgi:Putative porin
VLDFSRMKRALAALLVAAAPAAAQEPSDNQYFQRPDKKWSFEIKGDGLGRAEWTEDIFVTATQFRDEDRQRLQLRPRLELGVGPVLLGLGGEFNYSSDENTEAPGAAALIRDNYDSRDARVDLAFADIQPVSWVRLQGGRFVMPLPFTEMIWDKDLRAQGAALTLGVKERGSLKSFGVTGLWSQGSHVFDDADTTLWSVGVDAELALSETARLQLVGAYLDYSQIRSMAVNIRRQNTRLAGQFVFDYKVVDAVVRLRFTGRVPAQLVGDFCWNTDVETDREGIWAAASLGSLLRTRVRAEYTFASVDKDATLAAYPTDDFFWQTGWAGHRVDLGVRLVDKLSLHGVGQLERFKDSPRPEERDHWNKRIRAELRYAR